MARSVFTLCPAGYGRWTYRFIEALLMGSIPVILADGYQMPLPHAIDWPRYVVQIPESALFDVAETLRQWPQDRIQKMQANIIQDRKLFEKEFCLAQATSALMRNLSSQNTYNRHKLGVAIV
jgi:hypothetical protein